MTPQLDPPDAPPVGGRGGVAANHPPYATGPPRPQGGEMTKVERVQRRFTCQHCGAKPSEPCRSPRGVVVYAHNSRFVQAHAAKLLPLGPEETP